MALTNNLISLRDAMMRRRTFLVACAMALFSTASWAQAVVTSSSAVCSGSCTATTSAQNTTGSTLIVAACQALDAGVGFSVTDSQSNTWTQLTAQAGPNGRKIAIFYTENPTTNASQTVSCAAAGGSGYPAVAYIAFNGTPTTSIYDGMHAENVSATTTLSPGSVTPASANNVVVSGFGGDGYTPISIDSGFTQQETIGKVAGTTQAIAIAYKFQTSTTAQNPQWTVTTNDGDLLGQNAVFKTNAPTSGCTGSRRNLLGVGCN